MSPADPIQFVDKLDNLERVVFKFVYGWSAGLRKMVKNEIVFSENAMSVTTGIFDLDRSKNAMSVTTGIFDLDWSENAMSITNGIFDLDWSENAMQTTIFICFDCRLRCKNMLFSQTVWLQNLHLPSSRIRGFPRPHHWEKNG